MKITSSQQWYWTLNIGWNVVEIGTHLAKQSKDLKSLNLNLYAVFVKEVDNFLCCVVIQAAVH